MILNDLGCDIEYAEKLKQLGLTKKSIFVWYTDPTPHMGGKVNRSIAINTKGNLRNGIQTYTVAELGEMLPERIKYKGMYSYLHTGQAGELWNPHYDELYVECYPVFDKKEANARAKLLILVIKKNPDIVEELNNEY